MNKLQSSTQQTPEGERAECAQFTVDDPALPFVLHDILQAGEEYTFSGYVKSTAAGGVSVGGETVATTAAWTHIAVTFTAADVDMPLTFTARGTYYLYHAQLERGGKATDWSPAPEDIETALAGVSGAANALTERVTVNESHITQLSHRISMNVKETNTLQSAMGTVSEKVSVNESDVLQLSSRIDAKVSETTYLRDMAGKVSQGELARVRQALTSLTADKATVEFVQGRTSDLSAAIKTLQETLHTYFEFNAEGYMEVGKRGNAFTARLDNEKLGFLQNGQEVAYISNYEMLITVAKILTSMQLGGLKATVDAAGAVDWTWVGLG